MIANGYLLNLTLELLYRSDIMTDTENDCKQKNRRDKFPTSASIPDNLPTSVFTPLF